jgi:glycosyltransferase involved in cell wall biosynthesis
MIPAPDPERASDLWRAAREVVGPGMLSVVMPAFNIGGPAMAANLRRVAEVFRGNIAFEIVVVDDGSSDATRDGIRAAMTDIPELRPVLIDMNGGKGAALKHGFSASRGSHILFLDADLDLPPEQVTTFFKVMREKDAGVVIGSKRHPGSQLVYPWHRRLASAVYFAMVKILFGMPIRDTQTGMKLFRREVLEWVFPRLLVKRFAFDLELLAVAHDRGCRIAEAPVRIEFGEKMGCVRITSVKQIVIDTLAVFYRTKLLRYYGTITHTTIPDPPPHFTVVVACPAPSPYLDECLRGIMAQTYPWWDVIILPDEPSGRAWPERVREIPTGRVRPAEKRNMGIKAAGGTVVAFLDDDTMPVADWLSHAAVYFGDQAIAAVGGPATTPPSDPFLARLGGMVYSNPAVSGSYRYRYEPDRVRQVDDFPSCNLLVRREVLERTGGFRTDFWPGEDTYLCMDIVHRLKFRIVYDPRVHVLHHRRRLFLPHLRQIGRYALHRGYFARRFPRTSRRLSYFVPTIFVAGLVFGGLAAFLAPALRPFYAAGVTVYAAITLAAAVSRNPAAWILLWLGIALTHVVYGIRFLAGFLTARLPSEVARFDHPSEEPAA